MASNSEDSNPEFLPLFQKKPAKESQTKNVDSLDTSMPLAPEDEPTEIEEPLLSEEQMLPRHLAKPDAEATSMMIYQPKNSNLRQLKKPLNKPPLIYQPLGRRKNPLYPLKDSIQQACS